MQLPSLAAMASFWRNLPLRAKAAILVGLPLLLFGAGGLMIFSATSVRESNARLWVDHTVVVRSKLGFILNQLLLTEAAARAYVISRRKDGRPDLAAVRRDVEAQIETLDKLVQDNPGQRGQVGLLRALAQEKFAALEVLLNTPRNADAEVKEKLERSEETMEPLHQTLHRLDQEEARLQAARTATVQRTRSAMIATATQTLILGFLAGIGAALVFASLVVRRIEDLQVHARTLRLGLPLSDQAPSQDEIGRVKTELNLTSERLAERSRELRAREGELRAIIDNTTAIIYVKDLASRFLLTNRAMEKTFELSPGGALGKSPEEFFPAEAAEQIRANDLAVLESGQAAEFEEHIPRGGERRTYLSMKVPLLDETGAPYAICGISTDITERERTAEELQRALEDRVNERTAELRAETGQHRETAEALQKTQAQLLQAQKMEVAGTVACGIAHDFNNILTAIMGYASLALNEMAEPDRAQAHASKIMRTAERAAALSRQLLAFARLQTNEPRLMDPVEIIRESESMLERVLGDTITLRTVFASDLGLVLVDPRQIEQVLLNLVVNARDSMPRGGTVTVALAHRTKTSRDPCEWRFRRGWLGRNLGDR